jgi:hypothetical protein
LTVRQHLEAAARFDESARRDLIAPPLSPSVAFVWADFLALSRKRGQGFGGPLALQDSAIAQYYALRGRPLSSEVLELLDALDDVYLEMAYDSLKPASVKR